MNQSIHKTNVSVEKKATFKGHTDCVYTLEKSPWEGKFFSSGGDGLVVLWDENNPENGHLIAKLSNSVYALKLIEEQQILIVGDNFNGIHFINLVDKKVISSLSVTKSYIFDILHTDGYTYVASGDGSIYIIKGIEQPKMIKQLYQSDKSVRTIFLSDNKLIAGYSDCAIRIFDIKNDFTLIQTLLEAHTNSIFSIKAFNQEQFISVGRDAHIRTWKYNQQQMAYVQDTAVTAHMYAINNVCLTENQRYFATCSMDKSIKIWQTETMRLLKVIDKGRYAGHGTSINKLLWLDANSNKMVSCSDDRTISLWQLEITETN